MRSIAAFVAIVFCFVALFGCAGMNDKQQSTAAGAAIGAGLGGLIGYAIGGEKGMLIGAGVGAGLGALSGWAYAKRKEAVKQAALQHKSVVYVNDTGTEKVVAEPVGYETINNVRYAKVRARTYKKDSTTNEVKLTSDTYEQVPLQ